MPVPGNSGCRFIPNQSAPSRRTSIDPTAAAAAYKIFQTPDGERIRSESHHGLLNIKDVFYAGSVHNVANDTAVERREILDDILQRQTSVGRWLPPTSLAWISYFQ